MINLINSTNGFVYYQGYKPIKETECFLKTSYGYLNDTCKNHFKQNVLHNQNTTFFFDGFVYNQDEICEREHNWESALLKLAKEESFPDKLRGGFCGFWVKSKTTVKLFVDHTGNRALYYYANHGRIIISNRIEKIVLLLKLFNEKIGISESGIKCMLKYGSMRGCTTFVENIFRVEPGSVIEIDLSAIKKKAQNYYLINNTQTHEKKTNSMIMEEMEYYFKRALNRQFSLDANNKKVSIVELTGGLDSRMTAMLAHDLGFTNQINLSFSVPNHLDAIISSEIANKLGNQFISTPINKTWDYDYKRALYLGNWSSVFLYYSPSVYAFDHLRELQTGMLHTGVLGDAIASTLYSSKRENFSRPLGTENAYTTKVSYEERTNTKYENKEQLSIQETGFLGVQSSYIAIQQFTEWSSPFVDVDFMNCLFSVPFEKRVDHRMYIQWITTYHPDYSQFGWEKWGGLLPLEMNRKAGEEKRKRREDIYKSIEYKDSFFTESACKRENDIREVIPEYLFNDIQLLLEHGFLHEKCMALSAVESGNQIMNICEGRPAYSDE